ncbi:malate dehydrogenase [Streptomyces marianii]|uniref:L-lactate dehydrogenase n=1 Tax=Streptomyces marianii TaxID=1817406 RepID=A0A5R9DXS3_9ACTN|nr:L-lactate dehydrogenase [Streptomyces marianii]TLQ41977.1 L-lactate dehydrogenase [Streptomyces marianii]
MGAAPSTAVGVLGAGHLGSAIANALVLREVTRRVVLYDRVRARAEGEGWDIADAVSHLREQDVRVTDDLRHLSEVGVVVVAVGPTVATGQDRLELFGVNAPIIKDVVASLDAVAPEAVVVIVSNPVELLTRVMLEHTHRPPNLVLGSGTVNDTARLRYALGRRIGVDHANVHAYVIGEHGQSAFVVWSSALIGGVPVTAFPAGPGIGWDEAKKDLESFTHSRGAEIHRRKGHTSFGTATAVAALVQSVVRDEKHILPVSCLAASGYGLPPGTVVSLPCVVGASGAERCLVLPMDESESARLNSSYAGLQAAYDHNPL